MHPMRHRRSDPAARQRSRGAFREPRSDSRSMRDGGLFDERISHNLCHCVQGGYDKLGSFRKNVTVPLGPASTGAFSSVLCASQARMHHLTGCGVWRLSVLCIVSIVYADHERSMARCPGRRPPARRVARQCPNVNLPFGCSARTLVRNATDPDPDFMHRRAPRTGGLVSHPCPRQQRGHSDGSQTGRHEAVGQLRQGEY